MENKKIQFQEKPNIVQIKFKEIRFEIWYGFNKLVQTEYFAICELYPMSDCTVIKRGPKDLKRYMQLQALPWFIDDQIYQSKNNMQILANVQ